MIEEKKELYLLFIIMPRGGIIYITKIDHSIKRFEYSSNIKKSFLFDKSHMKYLIDKLKEGNYNAFSKRTKGMIKLKNNYHFLGMPFEEAKSFKDYQSRIRFVLKCGNLYVQDIYDNNPDRISLVMTPNIDKADFYKSEKYIEENLRRLGLNLSSFDIVEHLVETK